LGESDVVRDKTLDSPWSKEHTDIVLIHSDVDHGLSLCSVTFLLCQALSTYFGSGSVCFVGWVESWKVQRF